MRMVFIIVVVLFSVLLICITSKSDVGWAIKHKSVIGTKVPGEIRVMIIDSGVGLHSKLNPWVRYDKSNNYVDLDGHGTHVTGIVLYGNLVKRYNFEKAKDTVCTKVKVFSCRYFNPKASNATNVAESIKCANRASDEKIDAINYSSGGSDPDIEEYKSYERFTNTGGVVFVAAGNENYNLETSTFFPASYSLLPKRLPRFSADLSKEDIDYYLRFFKMWKSIKNFFVVQALNRNGTLLISGNWHKDAISEYGEDVYSTLPNNDYGLMSGTSQATPAYLHEQLKLKCNEVF